MLRIIMLQMRLIMNMAPQKSLKIRGSLLYWVILTKTGTTHSLMNRKVKQNHLPIVRAFLVLPSSSYLFLNILNGLENSPESIGRRSRQWAWCHGESTWKCHCNRDIDRRMYRIPNRRCSIWKTMLPKASVLYLVYYRTWRCKQDLIPS